MMQSGKKKSELKSLLSFSCYTVVTHLVTEEAEGVFVFRVKGGEGRLSVRLCQSKCLVEVIISNFSCEAVSFAPLF